jgi:hypothetical protein
MTFGFRGPLNGVGQALGDDRHHRFAAMHDAGDATHRRAADIQTDDARTGGVTQDAAGGDTRHVREPPAQQRVTAALRSSRPSSAPSANA